MISQLTKEYPSQMTPCLLFQIWTAGVWLCHIIVFPHHKYVIEINKHSTSLQWEPTVFDMPLFYDKLHRLMMRTISCQLMTTMQRDLLKHLVFFAFCSKYKVGMQPKVFPPPKTSPLRINQETETRPALSDFMCLCMVICSCDHLCANSTYAMDCGNG